MVFSEFFEARMEEVLVAEGVGRLCNNAVVYGFEGYLGGWGGGEFGGDF